MFIVATTRLQVQVILPIKKKKKKNDMIGFGRKFLINYNLSCRLAIRKQNMKSMVEASAAQILSSKGCIEEETYCYLKRFSMYVSLNKHLWQSAIPCWHAQFYFWCHLNVLILLEKIRCGEWSCIIDVGLGG